MERVVRIFKSFSEAEQHEREFSRSLTPQQRLDILLQLKQTIGRAKDLAEVATLGDE